MSKRVAVIDLGSNSTRMAIFERTSRFGFYILAEYKIKLRLGEGAYEYGGVLQKEAIEKGVEAFREFKRLINRHKIRKVLCVGTSALRDAPNANEFINLIKKEFSISIKCIDGNTEAYLGGIAALNLLSEFDEATTIDIGGGSTELAHIIDGRVVETTSLNIGTVRLKELFYDKKDFAKLDSFTDEVISQIPKSFKCENIIAIGGSLRAISNAIMSSNFYPLKLVHNFQYSYDEYKDYILRISNSKTLDLNKFPIKKDRYDTIREGAFIFDKIVSYLESKIIFTSGAGVREGVFLRSILGYNAKFPSNFNPSLKSLQDRFSLETRPNIIKFAKEIFLALKPLHMLDNSYLKILKTACKLCDLGTSIGYYAKHQHASYLVLNGLNYGYKHEDKVLIAAIIKLHGKKELNREFAEIKELLPSDNIIIWLSFIVELSKILDEGATNELKFNFLNSTLQISGSKKCLILKEKVKKMSKPAIFAINFS